MIRRIGRLLLIALLATAGTARGDVTATIDRTTVSEMDLLTLTLRLTNEDSEATPDFSVLEADFEIISQNSRASSSITIVNGRQTSQSHVDWVLTLRPKRQGILTIPAIPAGGKQSEPITVKSVPANTSQQQRGDRPVFFETTVDTTSAYVQGQIMYTVKLFYTGDISGDFPPPPSLDNAVIETVEQERRYESIINNQRYYALERHYAIFPQKSGELIIPRETFLGTRRVYNSRQRVSAVSRQHVVEVKPRPDAFPAGESWLPAKKLQLTERWNQEQPRFVVGEPVNRTLEITAVGVAASVLPPFDDLDLDNAKTYKDPPEINSRVGEAGVVSVRQVTVGIVPTRPGTLTLPEIRIPWWNTETNRLEVALIPASTRQVEPASQTGTSTYPQTGTSTNQPDSQIGTSTNPQIGNPQIGTSTNQLSETGTSTNQPTIEPGWWAWIATGFATLWLLTMARWWSMRREIKRLRQGAADEIAHPQAPGEKDLFKALTRACRKNDPESAHRYLFRWASVRYPGLQSVRELVTNGDDYSEALRAAIDELEARLYGPCGPGQPGADSGAGKHEGVGTWNGEDLHRAVSALRNNPPRTGTSTYLTPTLNPS